MKILFFSKMNSSLYGFGVSDSVDMNVKMGPVTTVISNEDEMQEKLRNSDIELNILELNYIKNTPQGYIIL